jgi:hypothetical protein
MTTADDWPPIVLHTLAAWCENCQMYFKPSCLAIAVVADPDEPGARYDQIMGWTREPTEADHPAPYCIRCEGLLELRTRPYYRSEDDHR